MSRSRTTTTPIPRETLAQTAAFWTERWDDRRRVAVTVEVEDDEPPALVRGRTPTLEFEVMR
jgi:hypothetical protein